MTIRSNIARAERRLADVGRRIDADCLQVVSRSAAARKRRALFTQLGEHVAHHFAADEAPLELDEVRDLIEQIDQLAVSAGDRPAHADDDDDSGR